MATQSPSLPSLCHECCKITFAMLYCGFESALTYQQTIESGKTCKLCRLVVCSFGRLQNGSNAYEIDQNYDASIPLLKISAAVHRHSVPSIAARALGPIMDSMAEPPRYLSWERHKHMPGICGSFGGGTTIQLAAPEGC